MNVELVESVGYVVNLGQGVRKSCLWRGFHVIPLQLLSLSPLLLERPVPSRHSWRWIWTYRQRARLAGESYPVSKTLLALAGLFPGSRTLWPGSDDLLLLCEPLLSRMLRNFLGSEVFIPTVAPPRRGTKSAMESQLSIGLAGRAVVLHSLTEVGIISLV